MLSIIATLKTLGFKIQDRFQREETGATAVEYALLVGFIAIVLIVGLTAFGGQLNTFFNNLAGRITK